MKRIDLKSLVTGALIGAGAVLAIAATNSTSPMPMEYQIVSGNVSELREKMNKFGADNWEFVATSGMGEQRGYTVFRRPRQ